MDIPRFRIGNDLTILWAISNRDGSPYNLENKVVRLFVTNERGREEVTATLEKLPDGTTNNVIRWEFKSAKQKVLGLYTLTAEIYVSEESKAIKRDYCKAFSLVGSSCEECTDGDDPVVKDGGELVLSSRLDVFRLSIPRLEIGTNGNWFIDGADSGHSALAGGQGLVNKIYNVEDFGKTYDKKSVIDTFNAYAINEIYNALKSFGIADLKGVSVGSAGENEVLSYNGSGWENVPFATLLAAHNVGANGGISKEILDRIQRLEELSFFERYDNDTIKTKYNIFSEREISAHGLNKGTGGSGEGGGSETLDGLLDVMLLSPKDGDVLVYNGTHWNNKPQSSLVPDLSPYLKINDAKATYATKNEIASFITADALTPLKNDIQTLDNGYATVTSNITSINDSLSKINTSIEAFQKILQYFHLTEDGETVYTTLNFYSEHEISAHGLNVGTGGDSSLVIFDDIIGVSLNNKKDGDVLVYNGTHWVNTPQSSLVPDIDITGYATTQYVDDADKKLRDDINKVLGWFTLEDDVLYTEHNLASKKEISAYGINVGQGESGVMAFDDLIGVSVAGKTTGDVLVYDGTHWVNTPQSEIVPDLSEYATKEHVSKQNEILSRNILSEVAGTYATTSYVDEKDKALRDAIALINDWFTLEDDVLHTKYNIASDEEISAQGLNKGEGGGGASYNRLDTWEGYDASKAGYVLSAGLGYGLKIAVDELQGYNLNGRVSAIENSYVSKDSGGVVNGGLIVSSLAVSGGSSSQFLKADGSLDGTSYLPISGGTIKGSLTLDSSSLSPLLINTSHSSGISLRFAQNHILKAEFNWDIYAGTYMYNHPSSSYIGVKDDGTPHYNGKPLIHSGNIGSQSVNYATNAGSISGSTSSINFGRGHNRLEMISSLIDGTVGDFVGAYQSGISVITEYVGWQMTSYGGDWENPYFRSLEDTGRWKPWRKLAFVDDNVASAQALANQYGGVGASVDNNASINFYSNRLYWHGDPSNYYIQFPFDGVNSPHAEMAGYGGVKFITSGVQRMLINSSGNVIIGTTSDNGSGAKLQVDGQGYFTSHLYTKNWAYYRSYKADGTPITLLGITGDNTVLLNDGDSSVKTIIGGGNVGIGTINPQYKLHVESASNVVLSIKGTTYPEASIRYEGSDGKVWTAGKGIMGYGDSFGFYSATVGDDIVRFTTEGAIVNGTLNAGATTLSSLYVSSDIVTNRIIIGGVTVSAEDGVLKVESDMYATGEISAFGLNKGESGGGGSSYSRLDTWIGYDSSKAGYVLSAGLGYDLKLAVDELNGYNLNSRLTTVESSYLSKNGGIVKGSGAYASTPLYIQSSASDYAAISIIAESMGEVGVLRYYNGLNGVGLVNSKTSAELAISDVAYFTPNAGATRYTLIHSGNIGSQSVNYAANAGVAGNANTLDGFSRCGNGDGTSWGTIPSIGYDGVMDIGKYIDFRNDSTLHDYSTRLMCTGNYANTISLPSASGTLALTTDNVASATKLATARTIWGQSFDGTDKVGGNLSDVTYLTIRDYDYGIYKGNYFGSLAASDIVFNAPNLYFYTSRFSLLINSYGNVTIGASDLASSSYRLYVGGDASFDGYLRTNQIYLNRVSDGVEAFEFSNIANTSGLAIKALGGGGFISFWNNSGNGVVEQMRIAGSNVGIGITDPQYKLHVDGTLSAGATTLSSLTVSSYVEAKSFSSSAVDTHTENGVARPWYGLSVEDAYYNGVWLSGYTNIYLKTATTMLTLNQSQFSVDCASYFGGSTSIVGELSVVGTGFFSDHVTLGKELFLSTNFAIRNKTASGKDLNSLFTMGESLHVGYDADEVTIKNGTLVLTSSVVTANTSLTVSGNTELQGDLRLRPSGKDFGSSLKFGDGSFCCIQEDTDDHMKISARHGVTFESSEGTIAIPKLSVGINGMTVNSPATFNDFIYSSSITPKTDNYYVLGNNNYKWYGVTAYNVNVHEAITIEAGKELRFKDNSGAFHTLKYDSDKEAFVFDGNVHATQEMSAKKINA